MRRMAAIPDVAIILALLGTKLSSVGMMLSAPWSNLFPSSEDRCLKDSKTHQSTKHEYKYMLTLGLDGNESNLCDIKAWDLFRYPSSGCTLAEELSYMLQSARFHFIRNTLRPRIIKEPCSIMETRTTASFTALFKAVSQWYLRSNMKRNMMKYL